MKIFIFIVCVSIFGINVVSGQEMIYPKIPLEEIDTVIIAEDLRAGSCASPDGPILCPPLDDWPTGPYLNANGYCYALASPTKNATYCWTFTSPGTVVELNSAFGVNICGSYSFGFINFQLYTCAPSCTSVGSGLIFTGLTPGACYTWCFETYFTGCGATGGFTFFCPYFLWIEPLPIELGDFYCTYTDQVMELNWETISESNCDYFEILRSMDGEHFEPIGVINGNGTSTQTHRYTFTDHNPQIINYYKLRQVDFNGGESFSDIISCGYDEVVISVNYYNLLGESVDMETANIGIYIKESVTPNRRNRVMYYKSF